MRLEALQDTLDSYRLLTENDKNEPCAHSTYGVDSSAERYDLAFFFCTRISERAPRDVSLTNFQNPVL